MYVSVSSVCFLVRNGSKECAYLVFTKLLIRRIVDNIAVFLVSIAKTKHYLCLSFFDGSISGNFDRSSRIQSIVRPQLTLHFVRFSVLKKIVKRSFIPFLG